MKNKFKLLGAMVLFISLFSSCVIGGGGTSQDFDSTGSSSKGSNDSNTTSGDTTIPIGGEYDDIIPVHSLTYLDFFDINNKIEMTLDISDQQLQKLSDDVMANKNAETYRIANSLTISITKGGSKYTFIYYQVGFRMKGNTSRDPYFYNNDTKELVGMIHYKLSFQETFDDPKLYGNEKVNWTDSDAKTYRKDRAFLGLEKLDARWNKEFDATHIKEYYALEMFRAFGIIAQHSNLMHLKMKRDNGKTINLGVFTILETADKELYKRSLQSGDSFINMASWSDEKKGINGIEGSNYGDMYKCSWGANLSPSSSMGVADADNQYVYDIKTNKDVSKHESLKALINTVTYSNYASLAEKVDLEYFAMYEAVSYVLGNPDDCRNNKNNYMLYFRRTDGKMIMIPIDQDRVLGITRDWNPYGDGSTSLTPLDTRMVPEAGGVQTANLYLKTFLANSSNDTKVKYLSNVERVFKSEWVTESHFNIYYEKARTNYGAKEIWETTESLSGGSIGWSLTEAHSGTQVNYSFAEYMYLKSRTAGYPVGNGKYNGEELDLSDKNLYLVGPFCGWYERAEEYKFVKNNTEQLFTLTYNHQDFGEDYDESSIKLKITGGTWDSDNHWRFDEGQLIPGTSGPNCQIDGLWRNCKIDFTITFSGAITWSIHN